MANISLRNPQYVYNEIPATGVLSSQCLVEIGGVTEYTLNKNVEPSTTVYWDISELARDFITMTYKSNFLPNSVYFTITIKNFAGLNATGGQVGTDTVFNHRGFESYGIFWEGVNPNNLESWRTNPTFLITPDLSQSTPEYNIYVPIGETGSVATTTTNGTYSSVLFNDVVQSVTLIGTPNQVLNIRRIDCTKYGKGNKVIFINKYGVQQELWFFLKKTKRISRTNEGYKSNTLVSIAGNNPPAYDIQDAPNKVFNTQAKRTQTFHSGYYPESANNFFEQLLLSEYVWMEFEKEFSPTQTEIIPVKVKTSSVEFKTSVNDKLIDYSIEFEDAFDYINNIR
jgi:hypothetical protein